MDKFLKEAIEENIVEVVEQLLEEKPQRVVGKDSDGMTPLMLAVTTQCRSVECIQALLNAKANVNAKSNGYTALHWVVADIGRYPYSWAATTREVIHLLASAGAELDEQNNWGWTPLMKAVDDRDIEGMTALLEVGAEPNTILPSHLGPSGYSGRSILSCSALVPRVMKALIEGGADVNFRDDFGETAFDYIQGLEVERFMPEKLECLKLLEEALRVKNG